MTPLHYAALQGHSKVVRALVQAKAEVNAKTLVRTMHKKNSNQILTRSVQCFIRIKQLSTQINFAINVEEEKARVGGIFLSFFKLKFFVYFQGKKVPIGDTSSFGIQHNVEPIITVDVFVPVQVTSMVMEPRTRTDLEVDKVAIHFTHTFFLGR